MNATVEERGRAAILFLLLLHQHVNSGIIIFFLFFKCGPPLQSQLLLLFKIRDKISLERENYRASLNKKETLFSLIFHHQKQDFFMISLKIFHFYLLSF